MRTANHSKIIRRAKKPVRWSAAQFNRDWKKKYGTVKK
jgi:hypothetical protein